MEKDKPGASYYRHLETRVYIMWEWMVRTSYMKRMASVVARIKFVTIATALHTPAQNRPTPMYILHGPHALCLQWRARTY